MSSALSLAFEEETVDALAPFLMDLLSVPEEQQVFILQEYIPEVGFVSCLLELVFTNIRTSLVPDTNCGSTNWTSRET